jgi:predicted ATPase
MWIVRQEPNMFTSLRLERFKNFKDAELKLGPFTVLIGANASGKSNIRDAFRFLHGIARGYKLADIIGEKYGEGGERVWSGIRGGTRGIAYAQNSSFALEVKTLVPVGNGPLPPFNKNHKEVLRQFDYRVKIEFDHDQISPLMACERFQDDKRDYGVEGTIINNEFQTQLVSSDGVIDEVVALPRNRPFVYTLAHSLGENVGVRSELQSTLTNIQSRLHIFINQISRMRFFDWSLDALRQPSMPGQDVLSDNGRNLSSVLYAICQDEQQKRNLLSWIKTLTPMDVVDFEFPADPIGRVLATLVERNDQKISLAAASDGTLRFLAFLAALLGPHPSSFYFFEELENGLHPTRVGLLLDLIENQVKDKGIQVVVTTHSPEILGRLSKESLENASLVYRPPDQSVAQIIRVIEMPDAERLIRKYKATELFSSGWFESTALYMQPDPDDKQFTPKPSRSRKLRERK